MKFMIKQTDGTIMGPHTQDEISALFEQGVLSGKELFQVLPLRTWRKAEKVQALDAIFNDTKEDATFVRKLSDLLAEDDPSPKPKKKIITKEFPKELDKDELKKLKTETPQKKDETVVLSKENRQKRTEHTRVTPLTLEYLEELKQDENRRRQEIEKQKKEKAENPVVNYQEDSTQMLDISKLQKQLSTEVDRTEKQLEEKENDLARIKEIEIEEKKQKEDDLKKQEKSKKKLFNLVGMAVVAIAFGYIFFVPSDQEIKKSKRLMVWPEILMPKPNLTQDTEKSENLYKKALSYLKENNYEKRVAAGKMLHLAMKFNFSNKKVIAKLVKVYGDLLSDSRNLNTSSQQLYRLTDIASPQLYNNVDVLVGTAKLYQNIDRPRVAIKLIEDYFLLEKKDKNTDLYDTYLDLMAQAGYFDRAQSVFEKLIPIKNKTISTYTSLFNFLWANQNFARAKSLAGQAIAVYPKSVQANLLKAQSLLHSGQFVELKKVMEYLKKTKLEERPVYWAEFFKYMGYLAAYGKEPRVAAGLFQKSLNLKENAELRNTLSQINAGDFDNKNELALNLILESKALGLIEESQNYAVESEWELAIAKAIEAEETAPHFIRAKLNLAKIQLDRGLFGESIRLLEKLHRRHPDSSKVSLALLNAYVVSYKFSKAQSLFSLMSQNEKVFQDKDFEKYVANFHKQKGNTIFARDWLIRGIERNPLDDSLYFELAKIYYENKKFKSAKSYVEKSIKLNPSEVEYRVFYASIVYELDGVDTAIGYLRRLMDEFPDNPYILGEIGIYYYRSGQLKDFEDMRKVVGSLPYPKRNLYDYLIRTSMLNKEYNDVVKYAQELISIEPGDIKTRMLLGQLYYERKDFNKAAIEFNKVGQLLRTYPKVRYYVAKIYLYTGQVEKALDQAKKEIKENPNLEDGYILLADIYMRQKQWNKADEFYKKAKAINSNSFDAIMGLGKLKYKRSQSIEALQLFKLAKRINPKSAEVYRSLGDAYRSLSRSIDAIESYELFLSLSADEEERRRVKAYLDRLR